MKFRNTQPKKKDLLFFVMHILVLMSLISPIIAADFELVEHETVFSPNDSYVLGGNVGRVDVQIGIFKMQGDQPILMLEFKKKANEIEDFPEYMEKIISHVKKGQHDIKIRYACFASPGQAQPNQDVIAFPHLPFKEVDAKKIKEKTGLINVTVINNYEAIGYALDTIKDDEKTILNKGKFSSEGKKIIVGIAQGLCTALLMRNPETKTCGISELGYSLSDFGAKNDVELEFKKFLEKEGCAAWGKVLGSSGGILSMYKFFGGNDTTYEESYIDIFHNHNSDPNCQKAVELYMSLYSALIRNINFIFRPLGGLYIINEMDVLNQFFDRTIIENIVNSECKSEYLSNKLQEVPIFLVRKQNLKLYGAAIYANKHLRSISTCSSKSDTSSRSMQKSAK